MNLEIVKAIVDSPPGLVLCTVMLVKGSAPRHAGSMMLAGPEGIRAGSVGGGRGESMALEACRGQAGTGRMTVLEIDMQGMEAEGPSMVCGGTSRILVEPQVAPGPYRTALDQLEQGRPALLIKNLATGETGVQDLEGRWIHGGMPLPDPQAAARAREGGHPVLDEAAGLFFHPLLPREKLLILGGGHVGRALAGLAAGLGFQVTVGDDRADFAAPGRFPEGVRTRTGTFTEIVDTFPFDPATYVVILTRSHLCDLECVRAVLKRPWRFAGFMGSRRKTRLVMEQARTDGFDARKLEALAAPIGLDLGAETPAELAVAIAAELVATRHRAGFLEDFHLARRVRRRAP